MHRVYCHLFTTAKHTTHVQKKTLEDSAKGHHTSGALLHINMGRTIGKNVTVSQWLYYIESYHNFFKPRRTCEQHYVLHSAHWLDSGCAMLMFCYSHFKLQQVVYFLLIPCVLPGLGSRSYVLLEKGQTIWEERYNCFNWSFGFLGSCSLGFWPLVCA